MSMDTFTRQHFYTWLYANVYDDEQEAFASWVEALNDFDLEYYKREGWSAAYRAWWREMGRAK
jgi:hypothetical protein